MAGQMMPSDRPMVCRRSCGAVTLRIAASRRGAACSVRTSIATTGPYHRATRRPMSGNPEDRRAGAAEIDDLDAQLTPLVTAVAPQLIALPGAGVDTAGQLLVTAGDNPGRLRSERPF